MKWIVLSAALIIAGCGVDGEPVQPTLGAGINVSPSGVSLGGRLGLRRGPISIGLGF